MIKTDLKSALLIGSLAAFPAMLRAQPSAHYCPGSEGLLAASVPPPGWYVRDYNVFYTADRVNDSGGRSVGPGNFNVFVYAQVPRVIWITDLKFLGGNVGVNVLMPIVDQEVTAGPTRSSSFGVGDIFLDSCDAWHTKQFDFLLAAGAWMPTGDSAAPTAARGYWSTMLTSGATWHMDEAKTWAISALTRYEINSKVRDTDITPGQAFTVEGGISKKLFKVWEVGPAGYYQQKVTSDHGTGPSPFGDRVAAIGPEISTVIPKIDVHASVRYNYEFMAENRSQGQTITLTLTKRF